MSTGTAEQLRDRERRARKIAALLNQIPALGIGPAMGNPIIPGADIRTSGGKWSVR